MRVTKMHSRRAYFRLALTMIWPLLAASQPAKPVTGISFTDSELTIELSNVSLGEVLTKVAALTHVKVDVPPEANERHLARVKVGPGPVREVLASLLREMRFNYVIQDSDTDPLTIQGLVVLPPQANTPTSADDSRPAAAGARFGPRLETQERIEALSRASAKSEESSPAASQDNAAPESNSNDTTAAAAAPEMQSNPVPSVETSSGPRPGAMAPPSNLNQDTINQQLQQMYQQRMQLNQPATTPASGTPGK
jgi:hypothetical protein